VVEKLTSNADEELNSITRLLFSEYIEYIAHQKKLARNTVLAYQRDLQQFGLWLQENNLNCKDVDQRHIMQFLLQKMQHGAKASSSSRTISTLKSFYIFLQLSQGLISNPCLGIKPPTLEHHSKEIMTLAEVEQLLQSPDLNSLIGIRDRAMLELLYATGISITELILIRCCDINLAKANLTIESKGAKQREIPLIKSAIEHVKYYLKRARMQLLREHSCEYLFVNKQAKNMTRQAFWYRIKYYVQTQGMNGSVSAQQLRKAFAVHLLDKGIEVEQMQYLLGHSAKKSTQAYRKTLSKS
jgi:integrase/recombinase XerD